MMMLSGLSDLLELIPQILLELDMPSLLQLSLPKLLDLNCLACSKSV
jgi:hypothetical protein